MPLFELLLTALDTLRANKVRAVLTTLGVIIGVLSVILLVSLGEGARSYLGDTFAGLGSNILQVQPGRRETKGFGGPALGTVYKITREDEQILARRSTATDGVSGVVTGGGTVRYLNRRRDTLVLGVVRRVCGHRHAADHVFEVVHRHGAYSFPRHWHRNAQRSGVIGS